METQLPIEHILYQLEDIDKELEYRNAQLRQIFKVRKQLRKSKRELRQMAGMK